MRRRMRGVTLVEFALVAPVVLFVIFGIIDFGRAINAQSTVTDASRQATRQAIPDATSSDSPFGTYSQQSCTGSVQTYQVANNSGCLTDTAIITTVSRVMSGVTSSVSAQPSNNCNNTPPKGTAWVCIDPVQSCSTSCQPTYANCTAASTALGNDLPTPQGNPLGDRETEWTNKTYQGCFLVSVTVVYTFQALTPPISSLLGQSVVFRSATTVLAEY